MYSTSRSNGVKLAVALLLSVAAIGAGCRQDTKPATISITVPQPNTIQAAITLTQRYGLGLSGSFPIDRYGSIFVTPETPTAGFGFGFSLNTAVFLKESWVNYREVTALPTGAGFPQWMGGPVMDVVVPPANIDELAWHFYFGTRGQFYVGAAALIKFINESFPDLRLEYSFYDDKGRVIVGLVFFGPKKNSMGRVEVPGGIFVGTNITPYLPPEMQNIGTPEQGVAVSSQSLALSTSQIKSLVTAANLGRPVRINGQSVVADLQVTGRDSGRYRSQGAIQGVIDRYMAASRSR